MAYLYANRKNAAQSKKCMCDKGEQEDNCRWKSLSWQEGVGISKQVEVLPCGGATVQGPG
jgi:hypothetical protein